MIFSCSALSVERKWNFFCPAVQSRIPPVPQTKFQSFILSFYENLAMGERLFFMKTPIFLKRYFHSPERTFAHSFPKKKIHPHLTKREIKKLKQFPVRTLPANKKINESSSPTNLNAHKKNAAKKS
ncbi:MAG: hypothetical protein Q4D17_04300 [Planctomycetia bacterium]|nr:hypothetical protein [Planctomycetia bacterium]